jgi:AcrR family transcriptional regulator
MEHMTTIGDPDVDAILEIYALDPDYAPGPNESLRERKKRRARQQISNMATAMFLAHGFDNVTVARIAAACEVSEQTVFNYFPTKESMFFDRSEPMITAVVDAVRERGSASLVEDVVQSLSGGVHFRRSEALDDAAQLHLIRLFCDAANRSPALVAAQFADLPRFIDEVSCALAQRIGADPLDPEVQLATLVIAGLLRVGLQSTFQHVQQAKSVAALNKVVRRDILTAARLAEPTLTAFDNTRETAKGRSAATLAGINA